MRAPATGQDPALNFTAQSREDRRRHWMAVVRAQDEALPRTQRDVAAVLRVQGREMARAVEEGRQPEVDVVAVARVIREVYEREVPRFARMAFEQMEREVEASVRSHFGQAAHHPLRQVDDQLLFEWREAVLELLAQEGATRVTQITDTTRRWLASFLMEAADEGWGPREAAREMMKRWESLTPARAERIARTELVSASNRGSMMGARSVADRLGLAMRKIWIATPDGRVREEHASADGQVVGIEEAFFVGGESLDHPGDPGASAANVVNCRCTLAFELA